MRDLDGAQYDSFASEYATTVEVGDVCAGMERPLLLSMLGDLRGKRVLDAGCGTGPLAKSMVEQGALVVGFDASSEMVRLARERLGSHVDVVLHDLRRPLPWPVGFFDVITCGLSMHYVEDWVPVLRELRRVLDPKGVIVMSTHHPMRDVELSATSNYLNTELVRDTWELGDKHVPVQFWRRPLVAIWEAVRDGGFRIDQLREPPMGASSWPHFLVLTLVPSQSLSRTT